MITLMTLKFVPVFLVLWIIGKLLFSSNRPVTDDHKFTQSMFLFHTTPSKCSRSYFDMGMQCRFTTSPIPSVQSSSTRRTRVRQTPKRKRIALSATHVSSWTQLWRTVCMDCGFVYHSADLPVAGSKQTGSSLASDTDKGGVTRKRKKKKKKMLCSLRSDIVRSPN